MTQATDIAINYHLVNELQEYFSDMYGASLDDVSYSDLRLGASVEVQGWEFEIFYSPSGFFRLKLTDLEDQSFDTDLLDLDEYIICRSEYKLITSETISHAIDVIVDSHGIDFDILSDSEL